MSAWSVGHVRARWQPVDHDLLIPLGDWADKHLPADSLILSGPAGTMPWTTYLFRRESTSLFVPISEPLSARCRLLQRLVAAASERTDWDHWSKLLGKRIYALGPAEAPYLGHWPICLRPPVGLYQLSTDGRK